MNIDNLENCGKRQSTFENKRKFAVLIIFKIFNTVFQTVINNVLAQ